METYKSLKLYLNVYFMKVEIKTIIGSKMFFLTWSRILVWKNSGINRPRIQNVLIEVPLNEKYNVFVDILDSGLHCKIYPPSTSTKGKGRNVDALKNLKLFELLKACFLLNIYLFLSIKQIFPAPR